MLQCYTGCEDLEEISEGYKLWLCICYYIFSTTILQSWLLSLWELDHHCQWFGTFAHLVATNYDKQVKVRSNIN
jgi:hypothetical protein